MLRGALTFLVHCLRSREQYGVVCAQSSPKRTSNRGGEGSLDLAPSVVSRQRKPDQSSLRSGGNLIK
jgi:hypothetical protein